MLHCGADDLGGNLIEEKITRAAGAEHGSCVPAAQLHARIEGEGLRPAQRTTLYRLVEEKSFAAANGESMAIQALAG